MDKFEALVKSAQIIEHLNTASLFQEEVPFRTEFLGITADAHYATKFYLWENVDPPSNAKELLQACINYIDQNAIGEEYQLKYSLDNDKSFTVLVHMFLHSKEIRLQNPREIQLQIIQK